MKYLFLSVFACILSGVSFSSQADASYSEFICFQDFVAETGHEVYDARKLFIRVKNCSCGSPKCTVGLTGGGWSPQIDLFGSSFCRVQDNGDGGYSISTSDDELKLNVGAPGYVHEFLKTATRPSSATIRFDEPGRRSSFSAHKLNCYQANGTVRSLPEWQIE